MDVIDFFNFCCKNLEQEKELYKKYLTILPGLRSNQVQY